MNFRPNKHEYYRHLKLAWSLLEACLKLAWSLLELQSKKALKGTNFESGLGREEEEENEK